MRNNANPDLVNINTYMQNVVKFHLLYVGLKILRGNKILTSIKGHNSVINLRKLKQQSQLRSCQ